MTNKPKLSDLLANYGKLSTKQYVLLRDYGIDPTDKSNVWWSANKESLKYKSFKAPAFASQIDYLKEHVEINTDLSSLTIGMARNAIRELAKAQGTDLRYLEAFEKDEIHNDLRSERTNPKVKPNLTLVQRVTPVTPVTPVTKENKRIGFEFAQSALKKILADNSTAVADVPVVVRKLTDDEIWDCTEEAIQGIKESASYIAFTKSRFGSK